MTLTSRIGCCLAMAACMAVSASAQGKKDKPPQKYPGEAVFRCSSPNGTTSTSECTNEDRILANDADNGYPYLGWAGTGLFSGNQEMHIGLVSGGVSYYSVYLDLGDPDPFTTPPCLSAATGCRFPATLKNGGPFKISDAEIQSNVVDNNGVEIDGGLFSIQPGQSAPTRFRIGFRLPAPYDSSMAWSLGFSATQYAGATHATVTRSATESCTFVFQTLGPNPDGTSRDLAGLWSFGTLSGRGKSVRIDEGLYRAPVKVTFKVYDAPGCPPQ